MWIILKKDNELFKMINTDVCACFQNVNGELGFEHGNYRHVVPTKDIADVQDILDYIAYCLKQKREICEVPSEDYEDWKSRLYIDKEEVLKALGAINNIPVTILKNEKDYVLTYHGIPVEELVKGFDKYLIDKEYERITEDLAKIDFINPISPEEIKKIKEQEKREEAIKRAIAKAYLFDKKNKK
jgi:hypothetical protein